MAAVSSTAEARAPAQHGHQASFWGLVLGSIGVVYGDIGTSPLYAMREALNSVAGDGLEQSEVIGVASLLLWALIIVVTGKYVLFVMRFDNKGEGGMLSLMALVQRSLGRTVGVVTLLGVIGAALFYGDAVLTPAISVLSAVEGLKLVTPGVEPYLQPLALLILVILFGVQSRGTAKVATFFGPLTAVWFLVMAALGVAQIIGNPGVLAAFSPFVAFSFLVDHGFLAFVVLGAVFLAITGVEALFADMGHFGRNPIRVAWLSLVLPALTLNYLGQAALVLKDPSTLDNPFFKLAPDWGLLPLVLLATAATVVASQAVISGAFSLTHQAIQLGLLPRLEIRHTSEAIAGQIYVPLVNRFLVIGVLLLILIFENSSNLASAYGVAVIGTILVTSLMAFVAVAKVWNKGPVVAALLVGPFVLIELVFLGSNLLKLFEGGFLPLLLGAFVAAAMLTWARGTRIVMAKSHRESVALADLARMLSKSPPHRVPGTAVFLTSDPTYAPVALTHNLKHNKVLHEKNVVLTVRTADTPRVPPEQRVEMETLPDGFVLITLHFGYMETPNVPQALNECRRRGLNFDIMSTSFFLGRRTIKASAHSGMPLWQDKLYIGLGSLATNATDFFRIPSGRVVEMGTQILV